MKLATVAIATVVACLAFSYVAQPDPPGDLDGDVFIVHTNDTHGYYDENLGFSAVAALVDDYESRGATVFLMDAGDAFQGTAATMITHGDSTVDVMNSTGYDVMVPGNHEFDYRLDRYLELSDRLDFATVCANMEWRDSGESMFPEYTVLERDGIRVDVFGLTTPDSMESVFSGYLDDVTISDPVEAASEAVSALEDENVDYVVALGHLGVDRFSSVTSDMVCSEVGWIDVFIDGHSHTEMEHGEVIGADADLAESDTLIASTGSYLSKIGVVSLGTEPDAYLVGSYSGGDPEVDRAVEAIRASQDSILSEVIGESEVHLDGERIPCRTGETGLGDLVCDSIRDFTGADFAVMNGGVFRASLEPGAVTAGDIYSAIPFENQLITKKVSGRAVMSMLEHSVSALPEAAGRFLQVSGMEVVYDSSAPQQSRILSVKIGGEPLNLDKEYLMATNDYVGMGGDGFDMLSGIPVAGQFGLMIDVQI